MAGERAREPARPDALFDDPCAAALAGPEGPSLLTRMAAPGDGTATSIPIRTRFFDDAILRLVRNGPGRQIVVLAAGMDARPFPPAPPPRVQPVAVEPPQGLGRQGGPAAELARPGRGGTRT